MMYKRAVYRSATMAVRKPEPESPSGPHQQTRPQSGPSRPRCRMDGDHLNGRWLQACEPAVSGMDALVTTLNTSNDFAAFVRAMRKRFKALA